MTINIVRAITKILQNSVIFQISAENKKKGLKCHLCNKLSLLCLECERRSTEF